MPDVSVADAVDAYLRRTAVGGSEGSGAYASNAGSILGRWAGWLEDERGVTSIFALEESDLRAYAAELAARTERGEYAASTASTYFAVVRAFLSWCESGGIIEGNPARADGITEALPTEEDGDGGQAWSPEARQELEAHLERRALEAPDDDRRERLGRLREYAMVATLAHTGIRGAELFRVPEDDRRQGARWEDVDFYAGTVRVLGTAGRHEEVVLPAPARTPLRRYWIALDPPTPEWPLFPTRHAPSIAARVRTVLGERGLEETEIESLLETQTAIELARERAIPPPAITTEGARSILRRLCADAGVDVDGDYLKPRGARRGLGNRPRRREATPSHSPPREDFRERSIAVADSDGDDA